MSSGDFGTLSGAGTVNWSASLSAVPEPSSYAAMAGAGVLGWVCCRRRRNTGQHGVPIAQTGIAESGSS
ncbi:PEP-CTERM sorting domain-containing protein [Synoicihabitans lomoniglobus]|uniref:PEP-CTERM sorting domain-containing protein n=1 Tax=Synoicihabitans lomoniglobus TaxID=2909285 RepID=A0AAF0CQM6_9BACT|nr:PEP-CTERM sorting domain-containing protein [Opitutaceae bacterium LMO-M01]WED66273.1 PEP-CTERM sorting domain-containing protein [Opitutaceae bacterium LMO-M01]